MAATASLSVLLQAVTGDFDKKMKKSSKNVSTMAQITKKATKAFAAFSAAVVTGAAAAVVALTKAGLANVDVVTKMSNRLGIATEELISLQLAAKLSAGVTDATLNMALQRMTRRLAEAAQGTGEAVKAIDELGLSAKALGELAPDQQFRMIADAMSKVSSQADRVRLSFKLFDSEGVALVNTLALGSAGLDKIRAEADKAGVTFDRLAGAQVEAANDAISLLTLRVKGLATQFAIGLAPAIQFTVEQLIDYVDGTNFASRATSQLSDTLLSLRQGLRILRIPMNVFTGLWRSLVSVVSLFGAVILKIADGLTFGLVPAISKAGDDVLNFAKALGQLAREDFVAAFDIAVGDTVFEEFEQFQKRQREELDKTTKAAKEAAKQSADVQINEMSRAEAAAALARQKRAALIPAEARGAVPVNRFGQPVAEPSTDTFRRLGGGGGKESEILNNILGVLMQIRDVEPDTINITPVRIA